MAYFYRYCIHEKDAHPFGPSIQAAWAQVIVLDGSGDSQQLARTEVEALGFEIEQIQESRLLTPDWLELLTPDVISAFQKHPERRVCVKIGRDV